MGAMESFIKKHADKIVGTLNCFDRVLFRGYLPLMSGFAMAEFLKSRNVRRAGLKPFLLEQAARLKSHAQATAAKAGRTYEYLSGPVKKDQLACKIAKRDGITEGLVCVLATLEPCRTFALRWKSHSPFVESARRKCLHLYYYFLDRNLGLIHVKLQTWFPFRIQVYVNGHEWLARKLDRHGIKSMKLDNCFLRLSNVERAQRLADGFEQVNWVGVLSRYARQVNPLLRSLVAPMQYYWVTAQAEYATDVLFRQRSDLEELMPRLLQHAMLYFGAGDVMSFLGRKLLGSFQGELVTDHFELALGKQRLPGRRIKHRMKVNWIKMYDKASVLRVETVINRPDEFRIRRRVQRKGRRVTAWVPLRKGVAYLFRYHEVSLKSNARYLEALSQVEDPTDCVRALDALTRQAKTPDGRTVRAFNPVSRPDRELFEVLLGGEYALRGFTNRDVREKLAKTSYSLAKAGPRQAGQVTRLLRRLRAHGLVGKIPHCRRWRVTVAGRRTMATAVKLREHAFPSLYPAAA
jgi:hypothetical protein